MRYEIRLLTCKCFQLSTIHDHHSHPHSVLWRLYNNPNNNSFEQHKQTHTHTYTHNRFTAIVGLQVNQCYPAIPVKNRRISLEQSFTARMHLLTLTRTIALRRRVEDARVFLDGVCLCAQSAYDKAELDTPDRQQCHVILITTPSRCNLSTTG